MTTAANQMKYRSVVMFLPREIHTGGERYLANVFDYLRRQGVSVEPIYIEPSTEGRNGIYLVMDYLLANFRFFRQARKLGKLSDKVFFEDFHFHPRLWLFNLLIRLVSGQMRTVVLMQLALFYHSVLKHRWARWLDGWAVRVFLRQSSLILANSEFTRQEVLSLGIDPAKVKVVYCGYEDILSAASKETQAIRESKEHKRILFVGQCAEYKGIEFLLRAIPMLSDRAATLDVVGNTAGEPDYFTRLMYIIEELGLEDRVTFHGHISDKAVLAEFYQRADIFVLPSLHEGFGIVLLEAMSFGLPIVATTAGAIPELVKDGENGLLVPHSNPQALAEAISNLLRNSNLRAEYGQNSYNFARDKREFYSWEAVGQRILKHLYTLG